MKTEQKPHPIRLKPPFYQTGTGCGLHRYLDAEFVARFQQDVLRRRFDRVQFLDWQQEERHSRYGQEPVLRLPLHRAFHVLSFEVICDRIGEPALGPEKISSAGFVIRRLRNGGEQAWIVEDGEALGWQDSGDGEQRDPDLRNRLAAAGIRRKTESAEAYSGEEVYPLHPLTTKDAGGKTHTVLFGYLPLGGFYYEREAAAQLFDEDDQNKTAQTAAALLPWPFGFRQPFSKIWLEAYEKPLKQGVPNKAFFELLRLWVNRYHLGEHNIPENEEFEQLTAQLWLYDETALPAELRRQNYTPVSSDLFTAYRKQHLQAYLKACFAQAENPLVEWMARQEKQIDAAGGLELFNGFDPLPNSNGKGVLQSSMLMLESQAAAVRDLLGKRLAQQNLQQVKEIPLPKFTQNKQDLYQVVGFVRTKNACGFEVIHWGDVDSRSIAFRVAAPFDPQASRPSVIQMPSLTDLRRGLAKGAAMITPADTFDLINKLKLNKGASADAVPADTSGAGLGIQWICSFSLPVITLVAMILLMIMISLLNILFFWMPWVRICLPFPKMKGGG